MSQQHSNYLFEMDEYPNWGIDYDHDYESESPCGRNWNSELVGGSPVRGDEVLVAVLVCLLHCQHFIRVGPDNDARKQRDAA